MTTSTTTHRTDAARLTEAVEFVRQQDTSALLPLLLPGLDGPELRALADRCRFSHAALLVFPADVEERRALLAGCGLAPDVTARPSVVVRDRLAARHGRAPASLDVRILRPPVEGTGRTVEVFVLTVPTGSDLAGPAEHERAHDHEAHLALEVDHPDPLVLRGLCALLARHGAGPDGGGYNPHEDGTVLYFTTPADTKAGYRRLELYVPGEHPDVLAAHLSPPQVPRPGPSPSGSTGPGGTGSGGTTQDTSAETLLRLLTGAWTTQALAVSAELRLPDALDTTTATGLPALARTVGADPDALASLLRYLAMLDVVEAADQDQGHDHGQGHGHDQGHDRAPSRDAYRLTPLGALLRTDTPASMRPLALMYGGPFYHSFAELGHTVRTGRVAFDHLYGENHFDHFARDPELAELFDHAMAASSRMFEPLTTHPVVTAAASAGTGTVVDVAGGNGALLARLLTAHPGLRGVLLERPHAVEAARRALDAADCGERCDYLAGDFADVPPGGDVYLLSRILHDWDDERCREILRHCARAMPAHADLLIVERVLPDDGSPSLATAWDLHMRCNVGGHERRADHFSRLLTDTGLTLVGRSPLPLGATVLHARRTAPVPIQTARTGTP
ncbi:methyltransferase [Kitasatospora sp. NPDC096147]|uniref:methyltransferase n=1 Tax=Kitasatospora sp. NPDC096147 TaxID=3364093 RepID=UPI0037F40ECC